MPDASDPAPPAPAQPGDVKDPVDLSTIGPGEVALWSKAATPVIVAPNFKVNITDWTRLFLACALLVILAAVVVFQFSRSSTLDGQCILVLDAKTRQVVVDQTKALCDTRIAAYNAVGAQTQIVFTAIVGLVGSVVGFFFGQNSDKSPR